ncbi:MAG: hypothetical protein JXR59_04830 [Desulfuromonadaceae bacterium]|nr:hypothetical protein [Desulfuromonadaceae bacterium]
MALNSRSSSWLMRLLRDTSQTCLALFRITLPIALATKLLTDLGVTHWLGEQLAPCMALFGLPGEMGLVWATAMVTNLYGGLSVYASLPASAVLTVAQISILTTLMLMAHGLPVELRIAQKAGTRLRCMLLVRLGGAVVTGVLLHQGYRVSGQLGQLNRAVWTPPTVAAGWGHWLLAQGRNMLSIVLIIFALLALMRALEALGFVDWLAKGLKPVLSVLGMSPAAAPITLIGMLLGLSYGGSLIIQEAQSGKMAPRDVFLSLVLMGLCHSLIEDTLLMAVVGGHWSAILLARILFSIAVVMSFRPLLARLSPAFQNRYFFRLPALKVDRS